MTVSTRLIDKKRNPIRVFTSPCTSNSERKRVILRTWLHLTSSFFWKTYPGFVNIVVLSYSLSFRIYPPFLHTCNNVALASANTIPVNTLKPFNFSSCNKVQSKQKQKLKEPPNDIPALSLCTLFSIKGGEITSICRE